MSYFVQLNLYDLSAGEAVKHSQKKLGQKAEGIWSTGIVVYGKEFYFGKGICYDQPGRTPQGETDIDETLFMELLRDMREDYNPNKFNILTNNMNHFCNHIADLLLQQGIPQHIRDQYQLLLSKSPTGVQMLKCIQQNQQTVIMFSNPLFTEGIKQFPLKIKKPVQPGEEQKEEREEMHRNFMQILNQFQDTGFESSQESNNAPLQRQTSYNAPNPGDLVHITNNAHLQKLITDCQAVVIDFWSASCGPCMRFKPIFESSARANRNKHIVFCSVDGDQVRDAVEAHNVRSIPHIEFWYQGKEHAKFQGANEPQFRKHLNELHELTMSKAGSHLGMTFKHFKPMNRLPISFSSTNQIQKMQEHISKLVNQSAASAKVDKLQEWLKGFDIKAMSTNAIDQLVALSSQAEGTSKIALIDLMRLIVLEKQQQEYIIQKHWSTLVEQSVIKYIEKIDVKDPSAKVIHNYHKASFMFLANLYSTENGRELMQQQERALSLIQFCTRSFLSCNAKTVQYAAQCLFNHLLCTETETFPKLAQDLIQAVRALDEVLGDKQNQDIDCLSAVLLVECRIMYKNHEVCSFIEDTFKQYFVETHTELKRRLQSNQTLVETCEDALSMVNL